MLGINYLFCLILCAYDVSDNPEEFAENFSDVLRVPMYYNLPASPFILQGIGDPSPCLCVFQWILVYIFPGYFLSLEGGFFLNYRELSMVLKARLVLHYVYSDTFPGGVLYTPGY